MSDTDEDIEQFSVRDEENMQTSSKTFLTNDRRTIESPQTPDTIDLSARNKGVTRVVACVAICFLLICFGMVGVSLLMSKNIDNIVRNSNEMLRKHNTRMSDVPSTLDVNTTDSS